MISSNCRNGEHSHCGGQIKFANFDNTDDCYPCACICHTAVVSMECTVGQCGYCRTAFCPHECHRKAADEARAAF